MGHGYGLDHARRQGSQDDYQDPWDVMSTAAWPSMQADSPDWGSQSVGPGLNAWNMRARGWLDESRVWKPPPAVSWDTTVTLRPLHRRDLPGQLAAELGEYLVELRVPERWDAAIPRACVLVHRFEDNRSYVMPGASGNLDLVEGDRFTVGRPEPAIEPFWEVEVLQIDEHQQTATVRLRHHPRFTEPPVGGGPVFGGVAVDGGGWILVGGKLVPVPPRGPVTELVEEVARYLAVDLAADVGAGLAARRAVLQRIVLTAAALHGQAEIVSEQPPGYESAGREER
jgi:hypothetical protein